MNIQETKLRIFKAASKKHPPLAWWKPLMLAQDESTFWSAVVTGLPWLRANGCDPGPIPSRYLTPDPLKIPKPEKDTPPRAEPGRYQLRKGKGKCVQCGKVPPREGICQRRKVPYTTCEACNDARNKNRQARQDANRSSGRCACGRKPREGGKTCTRCHSAMLKGRGK